MGTFVHIKASSEFGTFLPFRLFSSIGGFQHRSIH